MRNTKLRFITTVFFLLLLTGIVNLNSGINDRSFSGFFITKVSAETNYSCGENASWSLSSEGVLTISGTGAMDHYDYSSDQPWRSSSDSVVSVVIESGITVIGKDAFSYCKNLRTVSISDTVTTISKDAFEGCSSLESIVIPDSVIIIGSYAFDHCTSLTDITIGKGVKKIYQRAFYYCTTLTDVNWNAEFCSDFAYSTEIFYNAGTAGTGLNVVFGESVVSIPDYLFNVSLGSPKPKVTSVELGENVSNIGTGAFSGCNGLTEITIPDNLTNVDSSAFHNVDIAMYCNPTSSGALAVSEAGYSFFIQDSEDYSVMVLLDDNNNKYVKVTGYYGDEENVVIPDSIGGLPVKAIGSGLIKSGNVSSVTIPNAVTDIDAETFEDVGYQVLCSPDSAASKALEDAGCAYSSPSCTDFSIVVLTDGNNSKYISITGYNNVSEEVIIPDSIDGLPVKSISENAFSRRTEIKKVTISDSVIYIFANAFSGCTSMTDIHMGQNVTYIGKNAFDNCISLKNVEYTGVSMNSITIMDGNDDLIYAAWPGKPSFPRRFSDISGNISNTYLIIGNPVGCKKTYDYRAQVTFTAAVPEGGYIQWYLNGEIQRGEVRSTFTAPSAKNDYTVTAVIYDSNGNVFFDTEEIEIRNSFWDMVVYFFKHIFNPDAHKIEQK